MGKGEEVEARDEVGVVEEQDISHNRSNDQVDVCKDSGNDADDNNEDLRDENTA